MLESADQDLRKIVDLYEKGKLDQALSEFTLLKSKAKSFRAYYYAGLIRNKGSVGNGEDKFSQSSKFSTGTKQSFYLGKFMPKMETPQRR